MNQAEKEEYLREYSILKNQGKPFFPYAVAKDSIMAVIVMLVIMFLALASIALGYHSSGFGGATTAPAGSDAAAGNAARRLFGL